MSYNKNIPCQSGSCTEALANLQGLELFSADMVDTSNLSGPKLKEKLPVTSCWTSVAKSSVNSSEYS